MLEVLPVYQIIKMKNKKAMGWWIWIVIILVLILVGVGIWVMVSGEGGSIIAGSNIPSPPPLPE
jgi:flagellar basal body-associated protein FliL